MDLHEEILAKAPCKDISDFFTKDDLTQNLEHFIANLCLDKKIDSNSFRLPTEIDPHGAETTKYILENIDHLFPTIISSK